MYNIFGIFLLIVVLTILIMFLEDSGDDRE